MSAPDDDLRRRYLAACEAGDDDVADRLCARIDALAALEGDPEHHLSLRGAIAASALFYATHGVPVFPLIPGGKAPATPRGYLDATTDLDRVRGWWSGESAEPNLGIPTGVHWDVVDIDGAPGWHSWVQLDTATLPPIIGRARSTRPGGWHLLVPVGSLFPGNRAGFLPGCDYRGAGGYTCCAPSRLADGRRWRWVDLPAQLTTEGNA